MINEISRREFLFLAGLTMVNSSCALKNINNANKIYSLSDYVHMATYSADSEYGKVKTQGMGFILDGKYVTSNHISAELKYQKTRTPLGIMQTIREIENEEAYIDNIKLTELVRDTETDIAVYDAYGYLPDFPCKPSTDINLGDEVYIIGNPMLKGSNIRQARISDLDGIDDFPMSDYCFGIDRVLIGGDSGSPLVNSDYELIGMNTLSAFNQLGYATKIKHILERL